MEQNEMEQDEQQLSRILESDGSSAVNSSRIDKAIARASSQVAVIDVSSLALARMWLTLVSLLGPVFACLCKKYYQSSTNIPEQEDKQNGSN